MSRAIYALLVGIDKYAGGVSHLSGCVNDVDAMTDYLRQRVDQDGDFRLDVRTLKNEQATRQAVIDAFRGHLGQAGANDVALFCYSGHGSQEHAPSEFWRFEPDRLNETLVCHDSRDEGGWDLADKELARLIDEVSAAKPHFVVVLDCCHSGSGTRNLAMQQTAVRRLPTDSRQRPLDSYIFSLDETRGLTYPKEPGHSGWYAARHILMAACRENEEALETHAGGKPRGAFSYFLLETLQAARGPLTYRDLFANTNALIRSRVRDQSPQLETVRDAALDAVFLEGAIRQVPPTFTASVRDGSWYINGGAVHGIQPINPDDATMLELFTFDATADELGNPARAIAKARIVEVQPAHSRLEISSEEDLDGAKAYKALVVAVPVPRVSVRLEGSDADGISLVRASLATAERGQHPSLYVREALGEETPDYRLIVSDGRFAITSPENDRALVDPIDGIHSSNARLAVQRLEHIARWKLAVELQNPGSTIQPSEVSVTITRNATELKGPEIRLAYEYDKGRWKEPQFQITLKNNGDRTLYCALLDLTERFKISAALQKNRACIPLQPGESWSALDGDPIYASVPDKFWRQGIAEYRDVLKLIVSTQEFDARLMEQPDIATPQTRSTGTRSISTARNGSLNRLMNRIQDTRLRDIGASGEVESIDDWWASALTFTTVRPLDSVPLADRGVMLSGSVKLEGHPTFRAQARLSPTPLSARSMGNVAIPSILRDDPDNIQAFSFLATRSGDPGLSVLELENVENWESVTAGEPLRMQVPQSLTADERILPFAYDGEFFLPVGKASRSSGGFTDIVLDRLPAPTMAGRPSVSGSIRIFFQKVVYKVQGKEFKYPLLAAADVSAAGWIEYERNQDAVRSRVAKAGNIVLFIHGILGDTRQMAGNVLLATVPSGAGQPKPLASLFDLVLTFDYQNLNTPIEDIARSLQESLAGVGLGPHHGKSLTIVAHSMGGLVSRWFIERESGNHVVSKLVMAGTPNGGSPWPTRQGWATFTLALGLNGLSLIAWPAEIIGGLLSAMEAVDVNLDQMDPKSTLIKNLSTSPNPGVPYVMLAGNTSIIPASLHEDDEATKTNRIARLFNKLLPRNPLHVAADPLFFGSPNDIAVSVESMESLAATHKKQSVACDHLSYFSNTNSLEVLRQALDK